MLVTSGAVVSAQQRVLALIPVVSGLQTRCRLVESFITMEVAMNSSRWMDIMTQKDSFDDCMSILRGLACFIEAMDRVAEMPEMLKLLGLPRHTRVRDLPQYTTGAEQFSRLTDVVGHCLSLSCRSLEQDRAWSQLAIEALHVLSLWTSAYDTLILSPEIVNAMHFLLGVEEVRGDVGETCVVLLPRVEFLCAPVNQVEQSKSSAEELIFKVVFVGFRAIVENARHETVDESMASWWPLLRSTVSRPWTMSLIFGGDCPVRLDPYRELILQALSEPLHTCDVHSLENLFGVWAEIRDFLRDEPLGLDVFVNKDRVAEIIWKSFDDIVPAVLRVLGHGCSDFQTEDLVETTQELVGHMHASLTTAKMSTDPLFLSTSKAIEATVSDGDALSFCRLAPFVEVLLEMDAATDIFKENLNAAAQDLLEVVLVAAQSFNSWPAETLCLFTSIFSSLAPQITTHSDIISPALTCLLRLLPTDDIVVSDAIRSICDAWEYPAVNIVLRVLEAVIEALPTLSIQACALFGRGVGLLMLKNPVDMTSLLAMDLTHTSTDTGIRYVALYNGILVEMVMARGDLNVNVGGFLALVSQVPPLGLTCSRLPLYDCQQCNRSWLRKAIMDGDGLLGFHSLSFECLLIGMGSRRVITLSDSDMSLLPVAEHVRVHHAFPAVQGDLPSLMRAAAPQTRVDADRLSPVWHLMHHVMLAELESQIPDALKVDLVGVGLEQLCLSGVSPSPEVASAIVSAAVSTNDLPQATLTRVVYFAFMRLHQVERVDRGLALAIQRLIDCKTGVLSLVQSLWSQPDPGDSLVSNLNDHYREVVFLGLGRFRQFRLRQLLVEVCRVANRLQTPDSLLMFEDPRRRIVDCE